MSLQLQGIMSAVTAWLTELEKDDAKWTMFVIATSISVLVGTATWMVYIHARFFGKSRIPKILPLDDFIAVPLLQKEALSHDTIRFTFGLPSPTATLGLPTGMHLTLKYYDTTTSSSGGDGKKGTTTTSTAKAVQRSYTPVTDDRTLGQFSLVVKIYKPLPPKFPNGGKMSQHLADLRLGEIVQIKGPKGHVHYNNNGHFTTKPLGKPLQQRYCNNIAMMAGGTGITPMLQLLHAILDHPVTSKENSKIRIKLLYANQTPSDILVRPELENLAERFPDRFQLWYTVDRVVAVDNDSVVKNGTTSTKTSKAIEKEDWKYSVGFITAQMVSDHLLFDNSKTNGKDGATTSTTQFLMCGPPPMIKFACVPALQSLGYTEKDWIVM